jgi:alkylated DNA repair protein alkB family protein 4
MDPPTELPAFLRERPEERDPRSDPDPQIRIAAFDPTSQSCPGCPDFEGVHVFEELVTPAEADRLLAAIEEQPFRPAQSGKQKQHYGARVNFNKRKVRAEGFEGLPDWAGWLEARTRARLGLPSHGAVALGRAMQSFRTTDVFVLRYREQARSNLDFHVDDTFAYGEAILALSLESDSLMTFLRERPGVRERPGQRARPGEAPGWDCVRVALPARSLSILYGPARFEWQHAILAYDIRGRRTSVTLRTLSAELRGTAVGRLIEARAEASGVAWGDASSVS